MAKLDGGAWYLPGFTLDGRAVAGPDEDAFTLAATALERLALGAGGAPGTVHLVGQFPPAVKWGFESLLGHPVQVALYPGGVAGLREALARVEAEGAGSPHLILAADLPVRENPTATIPPGLGAGAAALRFVPGPPLAPSDREILFVGPDSISGAIALLLGTGHPAPPSPARGRRPLPLETVRPFVDAPLTAVSEGAYVPRARYLENLPSRWRLAADRCGRCGTLTFPARGVCRACSSRTDLSTEFLPRDGGTVVAATTIGKGGQPTEFDLQVGTLGDYEVALVELAPGVRVTLQVTDASPGDLAIGDPVSTRLRRLYPMEGEWRYGRKAIPFDPAGAAP